MPESEQHAENDRLLDAAGILAARRGGGNYMAMLRLCSRA
jgi:hypothetical protein